MEILNLTKKTGENYRGNLVFQSIAFFLFPLALYYFLLLFPPSVEFTWRFYNLDIGFSVLWLIFFAVLLKGKGFIWETIALGMVLLLFAMPLIFRWQSAFWGANLAGGILPWSDAFGYYSETQRLLLAGSHFSVWGTRRPLFAGFFATILFLNGNNFQAGLAILVAINAIAVYFAAREVQSTLKYSWAASAFVVFCYVYYQNYAGTVLTENLGFSLGLLGLTYLLKGARKEDLRTSALGLFALTLALNARAGAFFILPAIMLWIFFSFRKTSGNWRALIIGGLAVIFGFGANMVLTKFLGDPNGVPFSNYAHSLYGIAVGYKGWEQIYIDHSGIAESDMLSVAIETIKEKPFLFITGIARAYIDYFSSRNGAFSFAYFRRDLYDIINTLLWSGTIAGLFSAFTNRKQKVSGLILALFLGTLASVGLLPPIDSSRMRVYAATIPATIFIALYGISLIGQFLERGTTTDTTPPEKTEWASHKLGMPFSIVIIAACLFGPLVLKMIPHENQQIKPLACAPEQVEIFFHVSKNAGLSLVPDENINESYLPLIRAIDFRRGMAIETNASGYSPLSIDFQSLSEGSVLTLVAHSTPHIPGEKFFSSAFLITQNPLATGFYQRCASPFSKSFGGDSTPIYYLYPDGEETDGQNNSYPVSFSERYLLINKLRIGYGIALWIIFLGGVLTQQGLQKFSPRKRLLLMGNIALISVGAIIFLHSAGLIPLMWERSSIEEKRIHPGKGFSYFVKLAPNTLLDTRFLFMPARIYEDENLFSANSNNSSRGMIESLGTGRFSVVDGLLFFSTSDNSDPRINGRSYKIEIPISIRTRYQLISYALSLFGIFLYIKYFRRIPVTP